LPTLPFRRLTVVALSGIQALVLGACATITGDPTQVVHVETVDEHGQPIEGMRCHLHNASGEYFGDSPMFGLEVHRSSSDLRMACRMGNRIAEGRAISRSGLRGAGTGLVNLMMPGGSGMMAIDHFTGYRYTYPGWVVLRIGQKLEFDASDDEGGRPVPGVRTDAPEESVARTPAARPALVRSE